VQHVVKVVIISLLVVSLENLPEDIKEDLLSGLQDDLPEDIKEGRLSGLQDDLPEDIKEGRLKEKWLKINAIEKSVLD
jgi:hypothetical protein